MATTLEATIPKRKTMIVMGASQGIGASVTKAFLVGGYNLVANAPEFTNWGFAPGETLALVEGNIGQASTAARLAQTAVRAFGPIDRVVNNTGIFFKKPFIEYTVGEFRHLADTNLGDYVSMTRPAGEIDGCSNDGWVHYCHPFCEVPWWG